MQQRKEEEEGGLEDDTEAEIQRGRAVDSEKKIRRSEAGTEEKATPGMVVVVVEREKGKKK